MRRFLDAFCSPTSRQCYIAVSRRIQSSQALRLPSWLVKMMQISPLGCAIQMPTLNGSDEEKRVMYHLHQVVGIPILRVRGCGHDPCRGETKGFFRAQRPATSAKACISRSTSTPLVPKITPVAPAASSSSRRVRSSSRVPVKVTCRAMLTSTSSS